MWAIPEGLQLLDDEAINTFDVNFKVEWDAERTKHLPDVNTAYLNSITWEAERLISECPFCFDRTPGCKITVGIKDDFVISRTGCDCPFD